jgi:hypothetical protein
MIYQGPTTTHKNLRTAITSIYQYKLLKKQKEALLTGVDPSKETLALEKDKFPAKNEPPL